jgi:hypothetical protein
MKKQKIKVQDFKLPLIEQKYINIQQMTKENSKRSKNSPH